MVTVGNDEHDVGGNGPHFGEEGDVVLDSQSDSDGSEWLLLELLSWSKHQGRFVQSFVADEVLSNCMALFHGYSVFRLQTSS